MNDTHRGRFQVVTTRTRKLLGLDITDSECLVHIAEPTEQAPVAQGHNSKQLYSSIYRSNTLTNTSIFNQIFSNICAERSKPSPKYRRQYNSGWLTNLITSNQKNDSGYSNQWKQVSSPVFNLTRSTETPPTRHLQQLANRHFCWPRGCLLIRAWLEKLPLSSHFFK